MRRAIFIGSCFVLAAFIGCTGADRANQHSICKQNEAEGVFENEKNVACGCDMVECAESSVCFHHDCCNPSIQGKNPESCGCRENCEDSELCATYADARGTTCCDPTQEDDRDYCGCTEDCLDTEACLPDPDGIYTCQCDPQLAAFWGDNCGCSGEVCDGATDCISGSCQCVPTNDIAKNDDQNCGCNGPCPEGSHCKNGVCRCENENEIICCVGEDAEGCESACVPVDECECKPENHQGDSYNCACEGTCSLGDKCSGGECVCDPVSNLNNPQNCACQGECEDGEICANGVCSCPPSKLNDSNDCGCMGACPDGEACEGGVCGCPAWKLNDPFDCACQGACEDGHQCVGGVCQLCSEDKLWDESDCGCQGPCLDGLECTNGLCECPGWKDSYELDCGCNGPCGAGLECIGGVCQCPPQNMFDPTDCGCQGPCPWIEDGPDMECVNGSCQCPANMVYCDAAGNIDNGVPHVETACRAGGKFWCGDCLTFCINNIGCFAYDNNNNGLIDEFTCQQH